MMWMAVLSALTAATSGCALESAPPSVNPLRARIDAQTTLMQTADTADPVTRVHAIEALANALGAQAGGTFKQNLGDPNAVVQFAAALAVGDVRYAPAKPVLVEMAQKEGPNKVVYSGVIYALHCLGDDTYTSDLQRLLFHREKDVRASAAMVMGKMGEPSASGLLQDLLRDERDPGVRFQATEALALLGDESSAQRIEAYTKGYFMDLRLAAIPSLAKVGARNASSILLDRLKDPSPRVRVVAAGALAELGQTSEESYEYCIRALREPREVLREALPASQKITEIEVSSLQALAARALGQMRRPQAVNELYPLMKATDGRVRVAAAMSILKLAAPAGIAPPPAAPVAGDDKSATTAPAATPPPKVRLHTAGARD